MMVVCAGSFSWLQFSRCFHGVKKKLHVAINIISQNFKGTQMVELRKLNQFVYALFTQRKKKALTIARKCLIFNVDQPGLEPGTSRL